MKIFKKKKEPVKDNIVYYSLETLKQMPAPTTNDKPGGKR